MSGNTRAILQLAAVMGLAGILLVAPQPQSAATSPNTRQHGWVRRVPGLPSGYFGWIVQPYGKRVIAVNPTGEQDIIKVLREPPKPGQDRDPFAPPYKVMLLSPEEERVVEQFESNHIWAVAILAEKERSSVSWLAQGYDYWVLDAVRQVAYALRTPPQPLLFWQTLDKVDLNTRQVLHTLRMREIGAIALSACGNRLYVPHMTDDKGATVSIYDAGTMKLLKELPASQTIERIISSRDGRMLYLVSDEAFLMMDADKNEFIGDAFALPRMGAGAWALEVSEDGKEVYVGGGQISHEERGYILALDAATGQQRRRLSIGVGTCVSLAVVGNKLFAGCLDGIYVIDIDAWRKNAR